jgi:hypothetical protein
MACGDVQDVLHIVAFLRTIIRVLHVHIDIDANDSYQFVLREAHEHNLLLLGAFYTTALCM